MRYVGGKARVASWVAEHIAKLKGDRWSYIEPFLGGGNSFAKTASLFERTRAGDAHLDLMLMWMALQNGWVPPEHVSRDEYETLRHAEPSPLRGFVGFGASWGGKWFGGYVDTAYDKHHARETKPYLAAARRAVLRDAQTMRCTELRAQSFKDWEPEDGPTQTVIYCDPPYANTLGYSGTGGRFDPEEFWQWADYWGNDEGVMLIVSEATERDGWKVIAERGRKALLRIQDGGESAERRELLMVPERIALPARDAACV